MFLLLFRLMTADSIELVKKVNKSFKEYFKKIPDDRLLAMAINPLLVSHGFE